MSTFMSTRRPHIIRHCNPPVAEKPSQRYLYQLILSKGSNNQYAEKASSFIKIKLK